MSTVAFDPEVATVGFEPPPINGVPRRPWRRKLVLAAIPAWLLSGVFLVASDQQAVVTVFGRIAAERVMPGLHYTLPWPLAIVNRLKVREQRRLMVGGDLQSQMLGRTVASKSQFLTGDQNIIQIEAIVQYSVGTPVDLLFGPADPVRLIESAAASELARRIAHRDVDAVLTTEKGAIQEEVRAGLQRLLDRYRSGVRIGSINIEMDAPPPEAAEAFRDVASARADTSRIVSNAQGYANDIIPKARGQARVSIEEAGAYREKRVNEATGDASRFTQIAGQYSKAPQVTRRRLYVEAMEQILPRIRKVIVDSNGNVDLTVIRKGGTQ